MPAFVIYITHSIKTYYNFTLFTCIIDLIKKKELVLSLFSSKIKIT